MFGRQRRFVFEAQRKFSYVGKLVGKFSRNLVGKQILLLLLCVPQTVLLWSWACLPDYQEHYPVFFFHLKVSFTLSRSVI